MQIDRAIALAKENGFVLDYAGNLQYELKRPNGHHEDYLYDGQIAEMDERDFIDFYLCSC